MKRFWILLLVLSACALGMAAERPDYLIRIERQTEGDLIKLLDAGIPMVHETSFSLFAEMCKGDLEALDKLGYVYMNLDSDPWAWDYYTVGLRPDSDRELLTREGGILYEEENWMLWRVPRDQKTPGLDEAKVFLGRLPHKALKRPAPQTAPPEMSRPPGPEHVVPLVQQMVNSVVNTDIMNYWTTVVTNAPTGTRYSTSTGCTNAATYVYNTFTGLGIPAQYQNHTAGHAPNTIGTITGAVNPGPVYIVISHLDDTPSSGLAPGADDNASGVVAILESAKIMSCYAFKNTVKFIACTGEEQGLYGSTYYADDAQSRGEDIRGVIAFDMPGWAGDGIPVPENLDLNYNTGVAGSQALGLLFAACATDYSTGLVVDAFNCPSLNASDHYPFWQNGWAAVVGITDNEGYCGHAGNYPYYHTINDTIANCGNPAFFYAGVKATLATLAEQGDPFKITFNQATYGCTVQAQIILGDKDLNTNPSTTQTVNISVWSTWESTPETVTLTEDGINSMIFKGAIQLSGVPPVNGDGLLSVHSGDTITARYVDALDCNGAANVTYDATATVSSDCTPPVISNVQATNITAGGATITWTTNEAANSRVTYGLTTPPGTNRDDLANYVTSHSVTLTGLTQCTKYYFSVTSADAPGNSATDTNGGVYYSFTTYGSAYAMGPFDVEGGTTGWTLTGQWHQDTCKAHGGTYAFKAGSATCPGTYNSNTTSDLTWNSNITLGAAGHGYHLKYWEWYSTEINYDYCRPQISTNGGSTWTTLGTQYAGSSGGWIQKDFDLAAYTGGTVRIRFELYTDTGVVYEGWYVDDIEVSKSQSCSAEVSYQSNTFADVCNGTGGGSADGILDAGEDITVHPVLKNTGGLDATGISATLSTATPGVTVTGATAPYPNLAAGASAACNAPHFTFRVATSVACGTVINFTLTIAGSPGGPWTQNFSMTVGTVLPGGGTALDENFATGNPPTGWTIVDGGSGGGTAATWTTANPGARTATSPIVAPFEIVDSDYAGASATQNEQLITPVLNLSSATAVTLEFDHYFYWISGYGDEHGDVDVRSSLTGGAWVNVSRNHDASSPNPEHKTIPITTQAAGASDVQIRFYYYGGAYDYWWMVDNVKVTYAAPGGCTMNACTPSAGGPKPVPDGRLSGTAQRGAKVTADGANLSLTYDTATCTQADHSILYGLLTALNPITPSGGVCGIGNASPYAWNGSPAGNIWWVIVGDGGTTESSWGQKYTGGAYSQRSASASNQCGNSALDVTGTCP